MASRRSPAQGKSLLFALVVLAGLVVAAAPISAAGVQTQRSPSAGAVDSLRLEPVRDETVILYQDRPELFARADKVRDGLSFPPGSRRLGRHVRDGFQNLEYDEIEELDAAGRPMSLTQFDGSGRLVTAVRFDRPGLSGTRTTADSATKTAQRTLGQLGVPTAGRPQAEADAVDGGWDVHWDRVVNGRAVRGDETRVRLRSDGRIGSLAVVEHKLAAAPARPIAAADARSIAIRQVDQWFGSAGIDYTISTGELQWVGPNGAFDTRKANEAGAPYRLAWVANVKPKGESSEYVRLVTLFIDSGDGSIIGGDVVE
jgi:hypothetical protein